MESFGIESLITLEFRRLSTSSYQVVGVIGWVARRLFQALHLLGHLPIKGGVADKSLDWSILGQNQKMSTAAVEPHRRHLAYTESRAPI